MRKIIFKSIFSIISLLFCIYLLYFLTDIGFSKQYLPVSSIPCNVASIIMCIFIPCSVFISFDDVKGIEE
ncbi:MAG: hypothetical protein Q4E75_01685 [bacterium]|nr:hypothetical protein [bacterium]